MSSIKKRLSALGLAAASALAVSSFAAPAASAAPAGYYNVCDNVQSSSVGPLLVWVGKNLQAYDYCGTMDFGTTYDGVLGAPDRTALGNVKIGENLYLLAHIESYIGDFLGIHGKNNGDIWH